jgi:hypothetical protein
MLILHLILVCFNFQSISAYSGHYRPTDDSIDSFLSLLKENGVNLNGVQVIVVLSDHIAHNCHSKMLGAYLAKQNLDSVQKTKNKKLSLIPER